MEELLTTEEAANILKLKPRTLDKWRAMQIGPEYIKIGETVRYDPKDIQQFVDTKRRRGLK